jgi:hypothetical protein
MTGIILRCDPGHGFKQAGRARNTPPNPGRDKLLGVGKKDYIAILIAKGLIDQTSRNILN